MPCARAKLLQRSLALTQPREIKEQSSGPNATEECLGLIHQLADWPVAFSVSHPQHLPPAGSIEATGLLMFPILRTGAVADPLGASGWKYVPLSNQWHWEVTTFCSRCLLMAQNPHVMIMTAHCHRMQLRADACKKTTVVPRGALPRKPFTMLWNSPVA